MALTIVCNNTFRGKFESLTKKSPFKFQNATFQTTHSKIEKHYELVASKFKDLEKKRMERLKKYVTFFENEIKEIDVLSRELVDVLKKESEKLEKEFESNLNEGKSDEEVTTDIIKREHDKYFE